MCFILLPSSLTNEADSSFPPREDRAKEIRHFMRQGKCHAFRLPRLIRLNVNHVAFDHRVMRDW